MVTVWKYTIAPIYKPASFDMPAGARVIRVAMQGNSVCLWAHVDTEKAHAKRTFEVFGTGHPIPPGAEYCGSTDDSAEYHDGPLVWHVFEVFA